MMPDLQSSLLCDDVRQERNGKFMLIGLFDGLALPAYPVVFPRLCMVNRWCCGNGSFMQQSRIIKPDGISILAQGKPVQVNLQGAEANATCIEIFVNTRLEAPGTYWVEVLLEKQLRLRYPLRAVVARRAAPPSAPPATPPAG